MTPSAAPRRSPQSSQLPGAPSQPNSELPPERLQLVAAEAADDPTGVSCSRIVDRVTFNAHILETGPASYRLRTSKTSAGGKRAG